MSQIVPGRIYRGYELCDPEQFRRTEYFNDFVGKYDVSLYCALPMSKTKTSVEAVTLYTGFDDNPPGKETLDLVTLMIPHLQSALNLRRRLVDLTAGNSSLESALDLIEYGIILLNSERHVLRMNRDADNLLRQGNGLACRNGCLHTSSKTETGRLHLLIESSVRTAEGKGVAPGGSMLISRNDAARPLSVTVAPLKNVGEQKALAAAAAVVFVYDPDKQPKPPLDLLQQGYGLTKAEAQLALMLVEGNSLKDAAETCSVTYNTVRSQSKSIFSKTGVHHQTELVRLLLHNSVTT